MARKVTITVGDELFNRLNAVKSHFNISGICQEAIESEVSRQEFLLKENETMETTVERLKLEKEKYDEKYKKLGYEQGYSDAKKDMPYEEILELANCGGRYWDTKAWLDGGWEDYINEIATDCEDEAFNKGAFIDGWLEGVVALYEEVKNQL